MKSIKINKIPKQSYDTNDLKTEESAKNMLKVKKVPRSNRTSQNSRTNLKKSQPIFESKVHCQEVPNQKDSPYISTENKLEEIHLKKPKFDSCELNYDESKTGSKNNIKVMDSCEIEESGAIDEKIITKNIEHHMKNLKASGLEYCKQENAQEYKEQIYDSSRELDKNASPEQDESGAKELEVEQLKKIVRIIFKHYDWDGSGYLEEDEIKQIWEDFYDGSGCEKTEEEILLIIEEYDTNKDGEFSLIECNDLLGPLVMENVRFDPKKSEIFFQKDFARRSGGENTNKLAKFVCGKFNKKKNADDQDNVYKLSKKLCPQIFQKPNESEIVNNSESTGQNDTEKKAKIEVQITKQQSLKSLEKSNSRSLQRLSNWELQLAKTLAMQASEVVDITRIDQDIRKYTQNTLERTATRQNTMTDNIGPLSKLNTPCESEKKINIDVFFGKKEQGQDLPEGQINETADFDVQEAHDDYKNPGKFMQKVIIDEEIYDKNGNLIDKNHPKYLEAQEGALLSKIKEIQASSRNNSRRSSVDMDFEEKINEG